MTKYEKYLLGLVLTDGTFEEDERHGKVRIELNYEDAEIFNILKTNIQYITSITERTRDTNYKEKYKSRTLNIYSKQYREELKSLGVPVGKKDLLIKMPDSILSDKYLLRGIYDGDGSLGFTKGGFPFISLVTKSEELCKQIVDFIYTQTGKYKKLNRNKRDGIYNITVYKEDAQLIAKYIYAKSDKLGITRKVEMYKKISKWKRPKEMKIRTISLN